MKLLNDNILVSELQDDILQGTVVRYDADNPYMFCKVLNLSDKAKEYFDENDVLVIKRYAKEEYLPGQYFVSLQDVRCKMSEDEYNNMIERR